MTRNPANSSSADDSWEQLEADLFGVEAGKEYTAAERVASEPAPDIPSQPDVIVPKPIEDDDFGDFGAGLVESAAAEPPRAPSRSKPTTSRAKPAAKAPEPAPAKVAPPEAAAAFDLDDGPTDEELDAASDDDEADDEVEAAAPEDDPYWDALANWNWQEEERGGKPKGDSGRERSRPSSRGESSGPRRGDRNRTPSSRDSTERRSPPSQSRESRPAAEERPHSAHRRSPADRDRSRTEEPLPVEQINETPQISDPESIPTRDESAPEVKSRRQDRRRSRRHTSPAQPAAETAFDNEPVDESNDIGWPSEPEVRETTRSVPADEPRSRAAADDLDDDFEGEAADTGERAEGDDEEGQPRRRRSRSRRRRRPDRPAPTRVESPADEDIKELEEDPFVADLDDDEAGDRSSVDAGDEESAEEGRSGRGRRPRRRRRGGRGGERPAPAPAARVESEFDDEEDEVLEADDPFFEDRDREFVEDDEPPRPRRRGRSSSRPATVRATHLDEEDDDEDDGEPEPGVSYEDVPSWEEAISYLLNPSLVEGASGGGDRASSSSDRGSGNDRGNRGGGDRGSRPPRRGPRRDA